MGSFPSDVRQVATGAAIASGVVFAAGMLFAVYREAKRRGVL